MTKLTRSGAPLEQKSRIRFIFWRRFQPRNFELLRPIHWTKDSLSNNADLIQNYSDTACYRRPILLTLALINKHTTSSPKANPYQSAYCECRIGRGWFSGGVRCVRCIRSLVQLHL